MKKRMTKLDKAILIKKIRKIENDLLTADKADSIELENQLAELLAELYN